jgi:hypothetical protein
LFNDEHLFNDENNLMMSDENDLMINDENDLIKTI